MDTEVNVGIVRPTTGMSRRVPNTTTGTPTKSHTPSTNSQGGGPTAAHESAPLEAAPRPLPTIQHLIGLPVLPTKPLVRQSIVTSGECCEILLMWEWAFGLRSLHRSPAMDKGSYAHSVIRTMAEGGSLGDARDECADKYELVLGDLAQTYGDREAIPPEIVEERTRDLNVGIAVGAEMWRVLRERVKTGQLTIVGTEVAMHGDIRLGSRVIPVAGQADMLFMDRTGRIWVWDFKSATENESVDEWSANAYRRIQPYIYTEYWRQHLPQLETLLDDRQIRYSKPLEVAGFMFGVLAKPTIRRKKGSKNVPAESLEQYVVRVHEWYREQEKAGIVPCALFPLDVASPIPAWHVRRIIRTVERQQHILEQLNSTLYSPPLHALTPHEDGCRTGNIICRYNRLCSDETGRSWRELVAKHYTTRPDPLDSDPTRTRRDGAQTQPKAQSKAQAKVPSKTVVKSPVRVPSKTPRTVRE